VSAYGSAALNFLTRRDGIAVRPSLRRNERAQVIGMLQPRPLDGIGNAVSFEGLLQDLTAALEVATHDRVLAMGLVKTPTLVDNRRAEKLRRKLVLQFLNAPGVRVAKEEADHPIFEHAVDERIYDRSEFNFAAQLFKETQGVRLQLVLNLTVQTGSASCYCSRSYAIPNCSLAASDILLGSHGGSQTKSIFTSVTPGTARTLFSTSAGSD
jgi:hypothetical protein